MQVLERRNETIVGRFEVDDSGLTFVQPFDKRVRDRRPHPARRARGTPNRARWSPSRVTKWPTPTRGPVGRIVEVLGDIDEPGVDTEIILRKHGIPDEHSDEAIDEARRLGTAVKERDLKGRTDFRDRIVVTIDGEDARDFDDAISIERLRERPLLAGRAHRRRRALRRRGRRARHRGLRARHLGVFSRARRAHVPGGAGHRPVQPAPARRSAGAVVPDGSQQDAATSCATRCTTA